jgi:hypothetical protein
MTVFIVIETHWPDSWDVAAVYDSEEKAAASIPKGDNDAAGDGNYHIEEFEVQ